MRSVADCNEKTVTNGNFKNSSPYAHCRNVMQSVLEGAESVLELLEGVRLEGVRLEAVENCALYAVGTAGDSLCAEVLEVVLYVLEVLNVCAVRCFVSWKR